MISHRQLPNLLDKLTFAKILSGVELYSTKPVLVLADFGDCEQRYRFIPHKAQLSQLPTVIVLD